MTATPEASTPSVLGRTLRVVGGVIGVIFCLGAGVGYLEAVREHGALSAIDLLVLAAMVLVAAWCAWISYTGLRGAIRNDEPIGPSDRKSRLLLWLSVGLGAVLGLVLALSGDLPHPASRIFSDASLSGPTVAIMIAGLVAALILTAMWHRSIDEHEQASYAFGGIIALYVYLTATLTWWLLWRGGFAVTPDSMIVLLLTTAVWLAGWLWKRSR